MEEDSQKIRALIEAHGDLLHHAIPHNVSLGIAAPAPGNTRLRVAVRITRQITDEERSVLEDFRQIAQAAGFELDDVVMPDGIEARFAND